MTFLNKPYTCLWLALTVAFFLMVWFPIAYSSGVGIEYFMTPYYMGTFLVFGWVQATIILFLITYLWDFIRWLASKKKMFSRVR